MNNLFSSNLTFIYLSVSIFIANARIYTLNMLQLERKKKRKKKQIENVHGCCMRTSNSKPLNDTNKHILSESQFLTHCSPAVAFSLSFFRLRSISFYFPSCIYVFLFSNVSRTIGLIHFIHVDAISSKIEWSRSMWNACEGVHDRRSKSICHWIITTFLLLGRNNFNVDNWMKGRLQKRKRSGREIEEKGTKENARAQTNAHIRLHLHR